MFVFEIPKEPRWPPSGIFMDSNKKSANHWFDFSGENPWIEDDPLVEEQLVRFPKEVEKWHFPEFNLEEVARRFPETFESILHKLDCVSVLQLMSANKEMNSRVNQLMRKRVDPLNPFADVVLTIRRKVWKMGFKNVYFKSLWSKQHKDCCNRKNGSDGEEKEIRKEMVIAGLKGFKPKEIYFDFEYYFGPNQPRYGGTNTVLRPRFKHQKKHEHWLRKCRPAHGAKLTVNCGRDFSNVLDIVKPKELTLVMPKTSLEELFRSEQFGCVEYLRILRYRIDDYFIDNEPVLRLIPALYTQLVEFEFEGDIPSLPLDKINEFIQVWVSGDGKLQKLSFTVDENELVPVIYELLQDITNTAVGFKSLPAFMKKAISEDLDVVDIASEHIAFRLILSPPKRQMACVFYSESLASAAEPGKRRAHFGFHAFDYYPTR